MNANENGKNPDLQMRIKCCEVMNAQQMRMLILYQLYMQMREQKRLFVLKCVIN